MTAIGCKFEKRIRVTDFLINEETGCVSEVICGKEIYNADAVVLAVGISTLQKLIENRYRFIEFQNVKFILSYVQCLLDLGSFG